jgi:hypothetical protein
MSTVGIKVGSILSEVGSDSFFNALFSTIRGLLDEGGTKYPVILGDLYDGCVPATKAAQAQKELLSIRAALAQFPPSAVIWDIDDPSAQPPWGDEISPEITSMANYFVTSTGHDLLSMMLEVSEFAGRNGYDITIDAVPFVRTQVTLKPAP